MRTITLEVSDALAEELAPVRDRLPELLALSLHQSPVPARIYRAILAFLAGNPTPADLTAFGPTPAMRERLHTLLERSHAGALSATELDELERIEHFVVMIKAGALPVPAVRG